MRRSALALVTGLVLLACSVFSFRHEATVAHARSSTGVLVHAPATECREGAEQTHAHQLPGQQDRDFDACELTAFAHAATILAKAPTFVITPATIASIVVIVPTLPAPRAPSLLDAPKTSPPIV